MSILMSMPMHGNCSGTFDFPVFQISLISDAFLKITISARRSFGSGFSPCSIFNIFLSVMDRTLLIMDDFKDFQLFLTRSSLALLEFLVNRKVLAFVSCTFRVLNCNVISLYRRFLFHFINIHSAIFYILILYGLKHSTDHSI